MSQFIIGRLPNCQSIVEYLAIPRVQFGTGSSNDCFRYIIPILLLLLLLLKDL